MKNTLTMNELLPRKEPKLWHKNTLSMKELWQRECNYLKNISTKKVSKIYQLKKFQNKKIEEF